MTYTFWMFQVFDNLITCRYFIQLVYLFMDYCVNLLKTHDCIVSFTVLFRRIVDRFVLRTVRMSVSQNLKEY